MNAAVIHEYGGPEVLKYEPFPDPVVKPGTVLVKVAAAGINPVDTFERAGATKDWNPFTFPTVIGWDVSGTVVAVAPDVTEFAVGDNICAWASLTYADLCVVDAHLLAKVPGGRTAEMLLGKVKPGGVFASATGAPQNAKDHPLVRVESFVSKQDAAMLSHFVLAARDGRHVIPIDRRIPLRDASAGHSAVSAGGIGKVLSGSLNGWSMVYSRETMREPL